MADSNIINSIGGDIQGAASSAGQAVSAFSSTENALSAFYDVVTNGKIWRSLGWLLLGILLIFIGLWLWVGPKSLPIPLPV